MSLNVNLVKNSRYLAKHDCEPPLTLTVSHVTQENVAPEGMSPQPKFVVHFADHDKAWVLNWSNAQNLERSLSESDMEAWEGAEVTLCHDPDVQYAGKIVGGIRVQSAVSAAVLEREATQDIPFD